TAFTGVPSGAVIDSGTPKKARKYSDGVSSSIRRLMRLMLPRSRDGGPGTRSGILDGRGSEIGDGCDDGVVSARASRAGAGRGGEGGARRRAADPGAGPAVRHRVRREAA